MHEAVILFSTILCISIYTAYEQGTGLSYNIASMSVIYHLPFIHKYIFFGNTRLLRVCQRLSVCVCVLAVQTYSSPKK